MDLVNKYILIGGFAGSGSSAIVDLFKEFDNCKLLDFELRFITDFDGITNLENNLVRCWTPYNADIAIKRYIKFIERLSSKYKSPYCGIDHTKYFGKAFYNISKMYINSLIDNKYKGRWVGINNLIYIIFSKINSILKTDFFTLKKNINISYPGNKFYEKTAYYLNQLFNSLNISDNIEYFIIDEPFTSLNPAIVRSYFTNAKNIIIKRDPRDIFVNAQYYKYVFIPYNVDSFIDWYKALFSYSAKNEDIKDRNVLYMNFEDIVLNYDNSLGKILDFFELNSTSHIFKRKYFNPDISKKNIGLWKNYSNKTEIDKIWKQLKKYCIQ